MCQDKGMKDSFHGDATLSDGLPLVICHDGGKGQGDRFDTKTNLFSRQKLNFSQVSWLVCAADP